MQLNVTFFSCLKKDAKRKKEEKMENYIKEPEVII